MKKDSFSIIELIFVILLIGIITSYIQSKNNISKLKLAKEQLVLHLKYVRYIAMLDNKFDHNDPLWFRKRWSLKFLKCQKNIGGFYYIIYSDINKNGAISKEETLKDPLTNNYIYSYQCKKDSLYDKTKFVLLTKEYGITNINVSCNDTTTIGQLSFGLDGNVFTKLSTHDNDSEAYKLNEVCEIVLKDKEGNKEIIKIYPYTGFIE